jgi:nitrogen-specific signal transduction histidine kinase
MTFESNLPSALSDFDPADLLNGLWTGIIMLDAQLCLIYANVAAQDLFAFSLSKARGRPFADCLRDSTGLMAILRRALDCGEDIASRDLVVRPLGIPRDTRILDVTITPVEGQITGTHLLLELTDAKLRRLSLGSHIPRLPESD